MMRIIVEYWYVIIAATAAIITVGGLVYNFIGLPRKEQQNKVKEWLVWACIEAEKSLKTGTGQLKLRKVYDSFISIPSFSWVAKLISFETFSSWVDSALVKAKMMIINNVDLAKYVYGDNYTTEVAKLKEQVGIE